MKQIRLPNENNIARVLELLHTGGFVIDEIKEDDIFSTIRYKQGDITVFIEAQLSFVYSDEKEVGIWLYDPFFGLSFQEDSSSFKHIGGEYA